MAITVGAMVTPGGTTLILIIILIIILILSTGGVVGILSTAGVVGVGKGVAIEPQKRNLIPLELRVTVLAQAARRGPGSL